MQTCAQVFRGKSLRYFSNKLQKSDGCEFLCVTDGQLTVVNTLSIGINLSPISLNCNFYLKHDITIRIQKISTSSKSLHTKKILVSLNPSPNLEPTQLEANLGTEQGSHYFHFYFFFCFFTPIQILNQNKNQHATQNLTRCLWQAYCEMQIKILTILLFIGVNMFVKFHIDVLKNNSLVD